MNGAKCKVHDGGVKPPLQREAMRRKFLHQNEPKAIDNKPHHNKRTQERTQSYSLNVS